MDKHSDLLAILKKVDNKVICTQDELSVAIGHISNVLYAREMFYFGLPKADLDINTNDAVNDNMLKGLSLIYGDNIPKNEVNIVKYMLNNHAEALALLEYYILYHNSEI